MDIIFFLKGVAIGLSMAIPVGPIGIFCIRRILTEGRLSGLVSGLGVATADTVYACIAGLGLTFISDFLVSQQVWLRLIGGLFLCTLGLKISLTELVEEELPNGGKGLLGAYTSMFFLTLTYPMTILIFLGIFAGLGAGNTKDNYVLIAELVLGVFTGSFLWWAILSIAIGSLRKKFRVRGLRWINRISGILIIAFGVAVLLSLIFT
jgi:threonine/homoserine/homoserine lactone efflux protein